MMMNQSKGKILPPSWKLNDNLPPGWKLNDDPSITCVKTTQERKYYLNDKKTAIKLTKAAKADNFVVGVNGDKSFTLFFSTGAYVQTAIPLLNFYKKVCQSSPPAIRKSEVAGLDIEVKLVRPDYDKKRTPVQFTVKMIVEKEIVTVTFYETTVKMWTNVGEIRRGHSHPIFREANQV